MMTELHIEPGAAASCLRFAESMRGAYRAAMKGTPILSGKARNFVSRTGVNGKAHGATAGARVPRYVSKGGKMNR